MNSITKLLKGNRLLALGIALASFLLSTPTVAAVYNVRDYGAKGDGTTLDSPAINAAIEAAVSDGGGQVLLPAGTYLSGSNSSIFSVHSVKQ